MPVAILSDDDDAGLVCDRVAAKNSVPVFGLLFPDRTRTACIWGAPPPRNQKFADSPVEGTGFEPSVPLV